MAGLRSLFQDALQIVGEQLGVEDITQGLIEMGADNWFWAILIVIGGWYLSALLVRLLGRYVARRFHRPSITKTILRGIRAFVLFLAAAAAASVLGFQASNILLSVGVFSAVLGIVLAPIVGSVINGLFVLADQPYEIGDMIELVEPGQQGLGQQGYVEDMTLRYTKIFTLENTFLVIPNSAMRERDVINYSAEDERSRLSLELLVTYECNIERARAIMEKAAREVPEVIEGGPDIRVGSARYPAAPVAYIREYADHGVLLDLRYWVKNTYYLGRVRSKINERIWSEIEDADVEIAYPHQHLIFDETSGQAQVAIEHVDGERIADRQQSARTDGD